MTDLTESHRDLLRRAAEVGPGHRGRRRETSPAERRALGRLIQEQGGNPPGYLAAPTAWVDRTAKLFEAGDYPDKGVSVSEADLDRLCHGFDLPVPVLIEHADSPLEMGFLTFVERRGRELFGTVTLTPEANALIEQSGARKLSLGLSGDLHEIREVSLVRNPRVDSAQLFSGDLDPTEVIDFRAAYEQLLREREDRRVEAEVHEMVRTGRLLPAQAPEARALLASGATVTWNGTIRPVAEIVRAFVAKGPARDARRETAPVAPAEAEAALLTPEEAAFYRRHFPGVSLKEIAQVR